MEDRTAPHRISTADRIHRVEARGGVASPRFGSLEIRTATAHRVSPSRMSQAQVLEIWCPFHRR